MTQLISENAPNLRTVILVRISELGSARTSCLSKSELTSGHSIQEISKARAQIAKYASVCTWVVIDRWSWHDKLLLWQDGQMRELQVCQGRPTLQFELWV